MVQIPMTWISMDFNGSMDWELPDYSGEQQPYEYPIKKLINEHLPAIRYGFRECGCYSDPIGAVGKDKQIRNRNQIKRAF